MDWRLLSHGQYWDSFSEPLKRVSKTYVIKTSLQKKIKQRKKWGRSQVKFLLGSSTVGVPECLAPISPSQNPLPRYLDTGLDSLLAHTMLGVQRIPEPLAPAPPSQKPLAWYPDTRLVSLLAHTEFPWWKGVANATDSGTPQFFFR